MENNLNDEMLKNVNGGVGGANEATCPVCGKPMKPVNNEFGDDFWKCDKCNQTQYVSDAEYILMIKAAEAAGQTQNLVYPVWWELVNKKN